MAAVATEASRGSASPGCPSPKHKDAVSRTSSPSPATPTEPAEPTASSSKRTLEEEEELEAHRLSPNLTQPPPYKKRIWAPTSHLTQPPQPPQPDPRTLAEMAAQTAAVSLGYEGRRIKKFMQRRTVDYFGSLSHTLLRRSLSTNPSRSDSLLGVVYPSAHSIPNLLLPVGYSNLSTSVAKQMVHTSTNKIRCPVNVVKWMPDGRRLLTGSTSGEFTLWNGLTFNFETIMQAHDSAVRAMAWTRSGTYLISADQNGTVKYFQSNLNTLQAFTAHTDSARGLAFSPDDSKFASGGDDSLLKIWDFEQAKQIRELSGHGWDVKCLDWHQSKGILVSGSKDNLVKVWDPRSSPQGTCLATFHNHKNTVQATKFSPDGLRFATASRDMTVKLYDLRMMAEQLTLKGHNKEVCSLEFHPLHHDLLVSGGSEGSMLFWDLSSATSEALSGSNWGQGRMVGGAGDTMDVGEGKKSHDYLLYRNDGAHESNVWSLEWHPIGHVLCSGSNDHMTRFWERARPDDAVQHVQQTGAANGFDPSHASFLSGVMGGAAGGGMGGGDDSFIPGLGAAKSFIPMAVPVKPDYNSVMGGDADDDNFMLPGLGLARSANLASQQAPAGMGGIGPATGNGGNGGMTDFTPGTGANAPLPGTSTSNFGWAARNAQHSQDQSQSQSQSRPGGTYRAFY
ncbi:related to PFS2 - polyadenylation factor I subunit 2 [Melanopsichium pennsylvanicum]|uniref:Polyadenylation factor subunit 2 n=2 Tax=Melanopsichium pennsylvanicum TaxID=63383 RepID=A0AAJ4XFP2_9BASI|nr:related to PFS2-polyadenylation factor I subunit 2 [Melanopsichium pennsylvanicum 4]SNX81529.1 related to PFS2 - polyadenylation factor I subunit 2 [Melanopsichium pennsylvanicum]